MARKRGRGVGDVARYTGGRTAAPPFGIQNEDDPPISGVAFGLTVLVTILLLVFLAVRFGTARIESDLEARATSALLSAGYADVEVRAAGTAVHLTGSITNEQSEEGALAAVTQVHGVTAVDATLWPVFTGKLDEVVVSGEAIDFTWSSDSIVVSGSISTEEKRAFVSDTLATTFTGGVNIDNLAPLEGLDSESSWLGTTLGLVERFASSLSEGRIVVDPNARLLTVVGETEDKSLRNTLNELATEAGASLGFAVTTGVRLLEVPPTKDDVEGLQVSLDQLIDGKVVEFNVKSYDLTEKGKTLLDEISDALELAPNVRVQISGYTDSQGSEKDNLTLSERRAGAVLDYLVAKGAVRERFDVIGYGETRPIADNNTASGRARNRRIEFLALLEG